MAHTLDIYQSLWAMEQRIPGQAEESVEQHLARIAEAGYVGACVDPNVSEIDDCLRLKPAFDALDLKCMVNAFPHDVASRTGHPETVRRRTNCRCNQTLLCGIEFGMASKRSFETHVFKQ